MTRVYFDKGAFSQLWRSTTVDARSRERIRRRLCSRLFARRPQVILGPTTVSELAKAPRFQRETEIEYLGRLPDARYLAPVNARILEELHAAKHAVEPEPFLGANEAERIISAARFDEALWRLELSRLENDQREFKRSDEWAREATLRAARTQEQLAAWVVEYFRDPAARVRQGVLRFLRTHRTEFRLPVDEADWPAPEKTRTAWAFIAYQLARFVLVCRDKRRTDGNDQADWHHFLGAAYADEFVVEDRKFRQVVEACPPPKPRTVSFDDWAAELLR